jgi:hypothetical protein
MRQASFHLIRVQLWGHLFYFLLLNGHLDLFVLMAIWPFNKMARGVQRFESRLNRRSRFG